jgi:nitroreductase
LDALEAIRTRRMIPRVGGEAPSREEIEALLDLAVRAPNHHRTEPWRFYVLQGAERDRLAQAIADELTENKGTDPSAAFEEGRSKAERAPVIVVFTVLPSDEPKVVEQEEIASVAMAIENFLIGAHAAGLGAMLRTGAAAYHPSIRTHIGLGPAEKVVGIVYVGPPAADRPLQERVPSAEKTTWLG